MLILLPPSETKTRPAEVGHRPLDLDELALPALREARGTMLRAAQRTAAGSDASSRLGVPVSSPELVGRMLHLEQEPAAAPLGVYSGVLYDQLEPGAEIPGDRRVLVQSALLGLVDAGWDRIPAYRLSASSQLSRLGKAGSWWAPRLTPIAAQLREEEAAATASDARKSQVRTMDRSERVRTYNFPENRVSDHRIGYKAHNLDAVLGGDMEDLLKALHDAERQERLEAE